MPHAGHEHGSNRRVRSTPGTTARRARWSGGRPGGRASQPVRFPTTDGWSGAAAPGDVSAVARSAISSYERGWMSADVDVSGELTGYERERVTQVRAWYGRSPGPADRLLSGVSHRARWLTDRLLEIPRARGAVEDASGRLLEALDGQLLRHVDVPAVGLVGATASGERRRALQRADEEAARLHTRYVGGLSAQAAVAGAASLTPVMAVVAVAADVGVALLGSLRTAAHTLSLYGLPAGDGRLVPASVGLVSVASETDTPRRQELIRATVATVTGEVAAEPTSSEVMRLAAQQTGTRTVKEAVEQLLRRTVRCRAVAVVPVLGAAASASASGWLVSRVSEAAGHAGAVRFLHEHAQVPVGTLLGEPVQVAVT